MHATEGDVLGYRTSVAVVVVGCYYEPVVNVDAEGGGHRSFFCAHVDVVFGSSLARFFEQTFGEDPRLLWIVFYLY